MSASKRVMFWLAVLASVAAAFHALDRHLDSDWHVPDRWNPWAPLDIAAAPNLLTRFKLARASADSQACAAALATTGWRFGPLPDTHPAPGCGFSDAVRVVPASSGSGRPVSAPIALSCRAALPLAMWLRHGVEPAARRRFDAPLARIDNLGSYACRDIAVRPGRRSRHATADAIDISDFALGDGRRISVARDWLGADSKTAERAAFLHDVRDSACRFFGAVLSPEYNRTHADHLHLEVGGWRACR